MTRATRSPCRAFSGGFQSQSSCKGSIKSILPGQAFPAGFEFQAWEFFEQDLDELLVFFSFERASAVNQMAARLEQGQAVPDDLKLLFLHAEEVFGPQPPAHIDAPFDDTGIAAGGINENAVKRSGFGKVGCGGVRLGPIDLAQLVIADVAAVEVFLQADEPVFIAVGGDDAAGVFHRSSQPDGFASRCGAGVEDVLAGFGFEQLAGETGAGVLDIDQALVDPVTGNGAGQTEEIIGSTFYGMGGFRIPYGLQTFFVLTQRVESQIDGGSFVVPGTELFGFFFTKMTAPTFD